MLKNISLRDDGWLENEGTFSARDISLLAQYVNTSKKTIKGVSIRSTSVMTVAIAKNFKKLHSLTDLEIWCDVTRSAMRYIITISYLSRLYIHYLIRPEKLEDFSKATLLNSFHCSLGLNELDFIAISHCYSLQTFVAQSSDVTHRVIKALSKMPHLVHLDIENSDFDDEMANLISRSKILLSLYIGGTLLTGKGLKIICHMKQLQVLDLWNTKITVDDLDLLVNLPHLEYLSVGRTVDQPAMLADQLINKLNAIPSLKKIWLDGVEITEQQKIELEKRYENVQISEIEPD